MYFGGAILCLIKHEAGKVEVLYRYGGMGDLCRSGTFDIDAILQPATLPVGVASYHDSAAT